MRREKVVIMGAAGRDFHNFNVAFRDRPEYEVVAFTAAQIPNIDGRKYPADLAGDLYPQGIPIYPESALGDLIDEYEINQVIFSYSDLSHEDVMHRASSAIARGADFRLLGARETMLPSIKPVISICASRTGCGKSAVSQKIARLLIDQGLKVAVVRHPMPYGDLSRQAVQRFETVEDLQYHDCTIEEMEEYEPQIVNGVIVYAGVDYEMILRQAESEADIVIWEGGNNDLPFFLPNLEIMVVDPHRAGHEKTFFPGEANLLRADVVIINKVDSADSRDIETVLKNISELNKRAIIVKACMPVVPEDESLIRGKRALVIEDGPTVTHGGMMFGAGYLAAKKFGAAEIIDPRPYITGSIRETFDTYKHIEHLLPAMGYGREQQVELEATINRADCDVVVIGTPIDLNRVIAISHPTCRVSYEVQEIEGPTLSDIIKGWLLEQQSFGESELQLNQIA